MKRPLLVALFAIAMVLAAALLPQSHDSHATPEGPGSSPASSRGSSSGFSGVTGTPSAPSAGTASPARRSPSAAPAPSSAGQATARQPTAPAPPVDFPYQVNDDANVSDVSKGASFTLDVTATNFHFTPTFVQAAPGAKVTVDIKNTGTLTHTFSVDAQGIDVVLGKGKSGTATVTVPASGYVTFYCRFHWGGGMRGAIYTS